MTRFTALLLLLPASLLAGCSQDFASYDDVYVPQLTEQRYPIEVVDRPVKMTLPANRGPLPTAEVDRLARFARAARENATSPVAVAYPSGSASARGVSQQAVRVLVSQGVPRSRIQTASYKGSSDVVALSFTRRIAETKPCGDWSRNIANDPNNVPDPNFGCAIQNNYAAMVKNPEDFERARTMGPTYAASQSANVGTYQSGEWSKAIDSPSVGDLFD
jgi:pilus assembly protein CpaD